MNRFHVSSTWVSAPCFQFAVILVSNVYILDYLFAMIRIPCVTMSRLLHKAMPVLLALLLVLLKPTAADSLTTWYIEGFAGPQLMLYDAFLPSDFFFIRPRSPLHDSTTTISTCAVWSTLELCLPIWLLGLQGCLGPPWRAGPWHS